jgi:cytochrome b561
MLNRPQGYGAAAMAFHWITAALVVVAFTLGPGGSETRVYSAAKDFDRAWHETLGLAVLALTLARLVWKIFVPAPELPASPRWMEVVSRIVQGFLYLLLLAVPLTAITGAWLEGHPLTLGVLGEIAPLLPKNHALGERIAELHTWLGDAILWLAGFHAAAALFHHFVLRDQVLLAMLPARWRSLLG